MAKNKSFYKCKRCEHLSKVEVTPEAFRFLGIIELIAIIVFAVSIFIGGKFCLLGIVVITIIFAGFYAFSPFMVQLFKTKKKRKKVSEENEFNDDFTGVKKEAGKDTDTEIYSN